MRINLDSYYDLNPHFVFEGHGGNVRYGLCSFKAFSGIPASFLFIDGAFVGEASAVKLCTKAYSVEGVSFGSQFEYPLEDIWIPDFIQIDEAYRQKGYGKALLYALAEAVRLKNPNAVLSPADIGYRYHESYRPSFFGTSREALRSWNSIGRLYI